METYYLGGDVGGSRTRVLVADEHGQALGWGESGPGNHEVVGYDGLFQALQSAAAQALQQAGVPKDAIAGAGFGVGGYDWPSERADTLAAIARLGLNAPVEAVNDANLGLLAGSPAGWGVALVAGTGCNCRGWDRTRRSEGRSTGAGLAFGEGAGASELAAKAQAAVADAWARRGPATLLSEVFIRCTGAASLDDLLEGLVNDRYRLGAPVAPLIFDAAAAGDPVAGRLVRWAGRQLARLAGGVIRQLNFEAEHFDLVLVGSLYGGSPELVETLRQEVLALAPGARLVRLQAPPVTGGVLLGMEQAGRQPSSAVWARLIESANAVQPG